MYQIIELPLGIPKLNMHLSNLYLFSSSAESIIFLFLGLSIFKAEHHWDVGFILWTLLFCLVYRALGETILKTSIQCVY